MAKTAVGSTNTQNILNQANSLVGGKAFTLDEKGKIVVNYTGDAKLDEIIKQEAKKLEEQKLQFNKSENKLAKSQTIGSLALNAGAGILGLGQTIGGAKILKNSKAPKYPYELLPNQQLSARLGDVQRLSQIGDPVIREKMMRDFVNEKTKQDAIAKVTSGGNIGSYAAQSQANANRQTDNIRDIATNELAFKTQQGNILDTLIAKKMAEDAAIQKGRIDKFTNVDMPEYQAKRNYGEQLVNKGIGNLFNAGIGANQDASVLKRTNQNEKLFSKQDIENKNAILAERNTQAAKPNVTTTPTPTVTNNPQPTMNLSGVLPGTYGLMGMAGKGTASPLQPFQKGMGALSPEVMFPTPTPTTPISTKVPTFRSDEFKTGDMAYLSTPEGYQQYVSKVAKLTPEQILYPYQNQINPKTKKLYNINDVPDIVSGMTDYDVGIKHRMAQSLINQFGY